MEQLARALDVQDHSIEDPDPEPEPPRVEPAPITHDEAMESLLNIQKSNLNDTKLFDLSKQALSHIQCKKTQSELTSKNVQSSLFKFLQKS